MEKTIGKFISILRKAKGMTQKDLADLLNVSDKTVSRWERDESVPDLSLLPILAEIFGVTMDELILGEKSFGAENFINIERKREAKIEWILKKKKAGFQAASLISSALAFIGVLGAAICKFGFGKSIIGFCVACIGFVLAVCCQLALYIWAKSTVDMDGTFSEKEKNYFRDLKCTTQKTGCVILLCFVFCLPLASGFIMESTNIWSGASVRTIKILIAIVSLSKKWFRYGSILSGLCLLIIFWTNAIIKKDHIKTRYIAGFTIIAVVTFLLFSAIMYVPPYWISEGDTVESYSDFVVYMKRVPETMSNGKVQLLTRDEDFVQQLYDEDGTILCEYEPFNEDVERIEYGDNKKLPITLYTKQHYAEVQKMLKGIKELWLIAVFLEAGSVFTFYRKNNKGRNKHCTKKNTIN